MIHIMHTRCAILQYTNYIKIHKIQNKVSNIYIYIYSIYRNLIMTLNTNEQYRHYHCHSCWITSPSSMHRNHRPSAKGQVNVKMSTAWNVNTSLAPSEHIIMSWTGTKHPLQKTKKMGENIQKKNIPNILTKQMEISMFIYFCKTNIYIYIIM